MAVASVPRFSQDFVSGLDELLLEVCEELQLSQTRYDLAVERYDTLNKLLEGPGSPFRFSRPEIYPHGSMALGTTVKPIEGPHDLDFVLELSRDHVGVDPMALIRTLYEFLRQHGTYHSMTFLKRRCVRIKYADDFYMDVLPACRNSVIGGTCVKVPDRTVRGWSDSNPRGFIEWWFKQRGRLLLADRLLEKAAPIPAQQAVGEKKTLELAVQLIKRWRDHYYADREPDLAPVSIVLTTLAGHAYNGEQSVSKALTSVLTGIIGFINDAHRRGARLRVPNPSNIAENLSERWDANPAGYAEFDAGIRFFHAKWISLTSHGGNVNSQLEDLFAEPVTGVLKKRARRLQESRRAGRVGVTASGLVSLGAAAVTKARPNTFYGSE